MRSLPLPLSQAVRMQQKIPKGGLMTSQDAPIENDHLSRSRHVFHLSKELLDDIELSRLPPEALLLKAARLARLLGSEETRKWIKFELQGYNSSDPVSLKYMSQTGRWTNYEKKEGYWGPLAQIDESIQTSKLRLQTMRLPDLSGDYLTIALREVMTNATAINSLVIAMSGVRSRVMALLHDFASRIYYEKLFSGLAETIFEKYKARVDPLISSRCGDVLEKLPYVFDRLAEGDAEAISQALNTTRRIIDSFADAVYPPSSEMIKLGGNELSLGPPHHKNRINAYIAERIDSESRRTRLRQSLANIYDRVSKGVHHDVSIDEARAIVLSTYLLLGEILELPEPRDSSSGTVANITEENVEP